MSRDFSHSSLPTALSCAQKGRRSARHAAPGASPKRASPHQASLRRGRQANIRPSLHQRGMNLQICTLAVTSNYDLSILSCIRKKVCRTISEGLADHTSCSQDPNTTTKTGADAGVMSDCPPAEDLDDVSVTNSEVESAMNHRCRRAVLQDFGFSEEAFDAFSSADAYI